MPNVSPPGCATIAIGVTKITSMDKTDIGCLGNVP